MSVKFLVEHRTALNGKTVTVRGFVVSSFPEKVICRNDEMIPCPLTPSISLADTIDNERNRDYDVGMILKEREAGYSIGQEDSNNTSFLWKGKTYSIGEAVVVTSTVSSNQHSVALIQI